MAGRLVALRKRGLSTDLEYNLYLLTETLPSVAARVLLELLAGLPVLTKAEALRFVLARI